MRGTASSCSSAPARASLPLPEDHFGESVAVHYDDPSDPMFAPEAVDPVVDFLAGLAGDSRALELGIGTGRIALPLAARGVSVRIDLSSGLPPALGDRVQLQQVLLNLIINGADAMGLVASGPRILGLSSRVEPSDNILISIEDTGTGLEAGLSDRIFDPLFTTKPNGMGMGLAICKSIVEEHGGRIWALPRSPNGTVFQFTVPILDDRA